MADTNILLQKAYEVRDEVAQGGNTASRVGTLFADIIENFDLYAKKSDVISMIPEVDLSGYLSKKDATNTYLSKIDAAQLYTSLAAFSDLFSKVVIKEAVAEETDDDGNVITPAQPAVYGIRANYDFFSIKNVSAFGFSDSEGGGSGGSVDIEQILSSGTLIATINGINIYAPEGGSGASSWAELTGKPSWLTDTAPGVSAFTNDAEYITSSALSGYVKSSSLGSLAYLSTVATENIAKYAVTEDKIARGAVTAYQLADAAVQTAKIADKAITTVKITDGAITAAKIADVAVTTAKLADGAVTAAKLADGAIDSSKLQHSSMTLWGAEVALGASYDGDIHLGTNRGLRLTDGTHTAWLKYDSANNALYVADEYGNAVNLYSTGSVSAYGFSETAGGGSSVDVTQILSSGVHIATIAGVNIYAPEGGASSWADITGKPSWLETKPPVSAFTNDAGYITAAGQLWQDNGGTYQITGVNSFRFDDANVYMSGVVDIDGSFEVVGDSWFTGDVNVTDSLYMGDSRHTSAKYLWFAYRGIFFEGEGSTSGNSWYGTLCTHDAYVQKSINLRCFNPYTVIPQLAVGGGYLDGSSTPSYTFNVNGSSYINGYEVIDGRETVNGFIQATSYIETQSVYAQNIILKPYTSSGAAAGSGAVLTPLQHAILYLEDANNGLMLMKLNNEEYLRLAASNGYIQARKDIKLDDDKALRIGSAYLKWDATNNALCVTGADGAQVNFYATGGIAAYSGLDGSVSELTNLDITGQLTAARVNIGANSTLYEDNGGQLNIGVDAALYIGGKATHFDQDGWLYLTSQNEIQLTGGAILRVGSTAADHGITDVYADDTYVYITINGKRYRFTPSSTTTV